MQILSYSELKDKDGLIPLLDHAFNWTFKQEQFERFIRIDRRLNSGPVSFCAVENGKILSHVGVMDIETKTLQGDIVHAGGLYGVATLPGFARKGICTRLMNRAHEHFKDRGFPFAFLGTSPVIVAHSLYEKLGYTDLIEYSSAYKAFHDKKRGKRPGALGKRQFDLGKILASYQSHVKGRTGLVIRDKAFFKMLIKTEGLKPSQIMLGEGGYAVIREDKTATYIREMVVLNEKGFSKLISSIERRARGPVCDRGVVSTSLLEFYRKRGYMTQTRGYSVMMVKPLSQDASFKETYGDKFYLCRFDAF